MHRVRVVESFLVLVFAAAVQSVPLKDGDRQISYRQHEQMKIHLGGSGDGHGVEMLTP